MRILADVLAVDIRHDVVYLVRVAGASGRLTRAVFRREPVDPSLYSENPLEAIAAAIGRAARGIDLRRTPAGFVLGNDAEAVRPKAFPRMAAKDLSGAVGIAFRTGSLLNQPDSINRSFVESLETAPDGSRVQNTILIEASRAAVARAQEIARLSGLRLVRVSSPSVALGKTVEAIGISEGTSLVIDLAAPTTTLCVTSGRRLLLCREGDVSADSLSVDGFELEGLGNLETAAKAAPAPGAKLSVSVAKLATEISRSNRYIVTQYGRSIDRIYLAGPSREARALAEALASSVEVPIHLFEPERVVRPERLEGAPTTSSARCLGAALELLDPASRKRYDLLPRETHRNPLVARLVPAAVAVLLLAGAGIASLWVSAAQTEARLAPLRAEYARLAAELPGGRDSRSPGTLDERLRARRALRVSEPHWSAALRSLAELLPDGVWLTGLSVEEDERAGAARSLDAIAASGGSSDGPAVETEPPLRIVVTGRTAAVASVPDLLGRLDASGRFREASLLTLETAPDGQPWGEAQAGTGERWNFSFTVVPNLAAEPAASEEERTP